MYHGRRRFCKALVVCHKATKNIILVDRLPVARLRPSLLVTVLI